MYLLVASKELVGSALAFWSFALSPFVPLVCVWVCGGGGGEGGRKVLWGILFLQHRI